MKILFVRTYCPHPINYGSEMRAGRFVDFFRQKGDVDLLTLVGPDQSADAAYIKSRFRRHYYFDEQGEHQRLTGMEKFRHLLPWQLTGYYAKDFQQKLNAIVEENQYDLIFVFKLEPVFYFLQLPAKWHGRIVIDYDDLLSDVYRSHYKNIFTAFKNSYSLLLYQHKALVHFRRAFLCSDTARGKIGYRWKKKVGVVPNVFSVNSGNFFDLPAARDRLLYVGSLDYFPNVDGLKWFFKHIWPEAKKTRPTLKLTVIGKAREDSQSLHSSFNNPKDVAIEVNVPDVRPYYQNCFASVVPLRNGSGTRLKILESAAYGRPVLTTRKGMEGLNFQDGKNIFVFENSRLFLSAYESLLDTVRYRGVAADALAVLHGQYSPEAFTKRMNENWKEMVNSK